MKPINKLFFLPAIILLMAYPVKVIGAPNHVLIITGALLLILILLGVLLAREIKHAKNAGHTPKHILFFLLSFIIITLPYLGMFRQGPIPLLVYSIIVIAVIIYFKKTNPNNYSIQNLIRPHIYRNFVFLNILLVTLNSPFEGVIPDKFYSPDFTPKYPKEKGTAVYIDEAHHNYHTVSGLYTTFANILRKDGYRILAFENSFTDESLKPIQILVIANALNEKNIDHWEPPVYPAFDDKEMVCVKKWVQQGGALFLIADHPPFSSAAKKLGQVFGFSFSDATARQRVKSGGDLFCRQNKMLAENEITNGNDPSLYVDSIVTFTGQAFKIPDQAISILNFNENYALYGSNDLPGNIRGFSQGAYMQYGKGKLVVFGEAAMFSGQYGAGLSWIKIGLNSPKAKNNYKLLLNIVHWLDSE